MVLSERRAAAVTGDSLVTEATSSVQSSEGDLSRRRRSEESEFDNVDALNIDEDRLARVSIVHACIAGPGLNTIRSVLGKNCRLSNHWSHGSWRAAMSFFLNCFTN